MVPTEAALVAGASGRGEKPPTAGRKKSPVVAPSLIRVQPHGAVVVVAIGAALRVFDTSSQQPVSLADTTVPGRHGDVIRAAAFDGSGRLFASAGDDKLVKVWDASSWACLRTWRTGKKVSAAVFSHDGRWLLVADKFGVVSVLPTAPPPAEVAVEIAQPSQLLAHCCSIITCLASSLDGRFVASGDRDFKVRVSVFPPEPFHGAPEIESFCLGHSLFVTCVAFVGPTPAQPSGCLLSGGGDGTVRLWEPLSGQQLCNVTLAAPPKDETGGEAMELRGSERAVVAMAVAPDQHCVAVSMESLEEVVLLACNPSAGQLIVKQRVCLKGVGPPSSLAFSSQGELWLVAGAAEALETDDQASTPEASAAAEQRAHEIAQAAVARVGVLAPRGSEKGHPAFAAAAAAEVANPILATCSPSDVGPTMPEPGISAAYLQPPAGPLNQGAQPDGSSGLLGGIRQQEETDLRIPYYSLVPDAGIPGGPMLLEILQGRRQCTLDMAGSLVKEAELAMKYALSKRGYTQEERETRKRMRNDHRLQRINCQKS